MKRQTSEAPQQPGLPRVIDATLAAAGILLTAPLMVLSGLAILISDGFPILFHQRRVGLGGRVFRIHKLRSMSDLAPGLEVTVQGDQRVTPIGRILRRLKLDELPQLWNVLVGDMALVGPRPEVEKYVDLSDLRWQKILSVRPGLTDPATLYFRDEEEVLAQMPGDPVENYREWLQPLKLERSAAYLERRSWWTDIEVLCETVASLLVPGHPSPPPTQ